MQFLRTLFWVVFAVIAAIFSVRNWTPVTIRLFGGMEADAKLPVLVFGAFLIGLLPPYLLHLTTRWRLRRRLESTERSLAELRGPLPAPAAPADPIVPVLPAGEPGIVIPPAAS